MKKSLLLVSLCVFMCCPAVFAESEVSVETEITSTAIVKEDYSPQLIQKIRMQRNTIYNALNLTPCQVKQKDEIDVKRYAALEPELQKFCLARKKVKDIECSKNCDKKTLKAAKKELEASKDCIKKISNKYDKELKKILTSDQRSKYNMVRKLKRSDLKKAEEIHKNGQKPSDLRPFGQPISQAEYAEKLKRENSLWYKLKNKK